MTTRAPRGFALLSPDHLKAIAAKAGRMAHAKGTAYQWTAEKAAEAGRKGGLNRARRAKEKAASSGLEG